MMKELLGNSHLFGGNAPFVEELYEAYLDNPQSVPEEWREYFDRMQVLPGGDGRDVAHAPIVEAFAQRAKQGRLRAPAAPAELGVERKQVYVQMLINAYRFLGNRWAELDPLKRVPRPPIAELEPTYYDLTEADLETVFNTGTLVGPERATLREILQHLRETYCGTIGAEYMYISDPGQKRWIQQRLESVRGRPQLAPETRRRLLERVTAAETLEKYLHTRYVGQKRFSLEGGETIIAMMDELVQRAGAHGVEELVIGMAHRGRLNVLVNTLGKSPKDLFAEFEGKAESAGSTSLGDVKYHLGFSSDVSTPGGPVHLTLAFNPSHLEIVNPVVEGSVRARQHRRKDRAGEKVMLGAAARRCRFRGAGRRHGDAQPVADARLLHWRHRAPDRQQPDRVHHLRSARRALEHLLHRRGQDDRGADLPRERRRSGGGAVRHPARDGLPQGIQEGRRDRPGVLPPPRPQRAGRAVRHPAADVQEDRPAPGHAQALCRQAGGAGRGSARGTGAS